MILTCPSCGTQYVVKDGAIPPQGRQVRCASCKHSWHQNPEGAEAIEGDIEAEPTPPAVEEPAASRSDMEAVPAAPEEDAEDESFAEAALIEPRSGPEAEERAYEEAMIEEAVETPSEYAPEAPIDTEPAEAPVQSEPAPQADVAEEASDWREPPQAEVQDDEFSPFPPAEGEVEPRRRSPIVGLLIVLLVVAALAAAFWFLAPPEWKSRLGISAGGTSPLALVTTHMDRQRLESGNELLTITGRVINPTAKDQDVPPLNAQLRSKGGKVVYSWTIAPPARTLPPGASASFNSAEVNVPPGGEERTITLGPPKA